MSTTLFKNLPNLTAAQVTELNSLENTNAGTTNTPADGSFAIQNTDDITKQVAVALAGATTSTTSTLTFSQSANRTITFPNATDTLVGKATTDVLTNKTITGAINTDYKVLAATADYSATTTAATLTGFSWTVAVGTYAFELNLPATMTTVGGLTVNFKLTTAVLTSIQYQTYAATAADNTTAVSTQGTTTTDLTKVFDSKTAAYTLVNVKGSMVVGTGGTFAWQATQNTSAGSADASHVLLGAYAKMVRVA